MVGDAVRSFRRDGARRTIMHTVLLILLVSVFDRSHASFWSESASLDVAFTFRLVDVPLDSSTPRSVNDNIAYQWNTDTDDTYTTPDDCNNDASNGETDCIYWRRIQCRQHASCREISDRIFEWEQSTVTWKIGRYVAMGTVGQGNSMTTSKTKPQFVLWNPESTVKMQFDTESNELSVKVFHHVLRSSCHGHETMDDYETLVCNERERMGGQSYLTLLAARNIPDLDGFGAAGGYSDPKLRVTMPWQDPYFSAETATIANCDNSGAACEGSSKNRVSLGRKFSGTTVILDVWDNDLFFEGLDDYVGRAVTSTIFCSKLSSKTLNTGSVGNIENLFVDIDAFNEALPTTSNSEENLLCAEEMWLPVNLGNAADNPYEAWYAAAVTDGEMLNPCFRTDFVSVDCDIYGDHLTTAQTNNGEFSACNSTVDDDGTKHCTCSSSWIPSDAPCVKIRVEMERFDVTVDQYNGESAIQPDITVAPVSGELPQPYSSYAPFLDDASTPMSIDQKGLNDGALCIQTALSDLEVTRQTYLAFTANFHSDVFVYRKYTDMYSLEGGAFQTLKSNTLPPWLCARSGRTYSGDTLAAGALSDASRYDVCTDQADAGAGSEVGLRGDWIELAGDWMLGKYDPPQAALIVGTGIGGESAIESNYYAFMNTFVGNERVFLGGNLYGRDPQNSLINNQYVVLIKMLASVESGETTLDFSYKELGVESDEVATDERSRFNALIVFFFICFALTLGATWRFMSILSYDLSDTAIASSLFSLQIDADGSPSAKREASKDNNDPRLEKRKHILGTLWLTYDNDNADPTNILTRRNLFFAVNAVRMLCSVPWLLWVAVGGVLILRVNPAVVGILWNTVGIAIWIGLFAALKWRAQGYRMNATVMGMLSTSVLLVIVFIYLVVIFDPMRAANGLDFTALALIFVTSNMVLMSWLVFVNHSRLRDAYECLRRVSGARDEVMAEIMGVIDAKSKDGTGPTKRRGINVFIESVYTIDSSDPMFWYADPMADAIRSGSNQKRTFMARMMFLGAQSCFALFALVSAYAKDFVDEEATQADLVLRKEVSDVNEANQACIVWFNVFIFDVALWLLRRGNFTWGPGYETFIMAITRFALVLFVGEHWLVGHSVAYFCLVLAVAHEVVSQRFPHHSDDRAAGATAYFGYIRELTSQQRNDISGQPEFVVGFLSFFNICVMLIAKANDDDPELSILGTTYSSSTIAVFMLCMSITYTLLLCAARTSKLDKHELLNSEKFFAFSFVSLPIVFAGASWLSIFCSGVFMSVLTGSNIFWEFALFFPPIVACANEFWKRYTLNGCNVTQPASFRGKSSEVRSDRENEEDTKTSPDFALPSLHAIKDRVGGTAKDLGIASFALPPLVKSTAESVGKSAYSIVMPALPIKMPHVGGEGTEDRTQVVETDEVGGDNDADSATKDAEDEVVTSSRESKISRSACARCFSICFTRKRQDKEETDEGAVATKDSESKDTSSTKDANEEIEGTDETDSLLNKPKDDSDASTDPCQMSAFQAFWTGNLTRSDYVTIALAFTTLALIFAFGLFVAASEEPSYVGHLIWMVIVEFILTAMPVFEWFQTYRFDSDMVASVVLSSVGAVAIAAYLFVEVFDSNINDNGCLFVLLFLYWYPTGWISFVGFYTWRDDNWRMTKFTENIFLFMASSVILWLPIVHIWLQFWLTTVEKNAIACEQIEDLAREFGGAPDCATFGTSDVDISPPEETSTNSTGLLLSVGLYMLCVSVFFGMYVLKRWSANDFYVPTHLKKVGRVIVFVFASFVLFLGIVGVNITFCFSIGLFTLAGYAFSIYIATIVKHRVQNHPIFVSPYVFPVYAYSVERNELIDVTGAYNMAYVGLSLLLVWGAGLATFVQPLSVGVAVISIAIISLVMFSAHLVSSTPIQLGEATRCCDEVVFDTAAAFAMERYHKLRAPFQFDFAEAKHRSSMRTNADAMLQKYGASTKTDERTSSENGRGRNLRRRKRGEEDEKRQNAMHHASYLTKAQWSLYYSGPAPSLRQIKSPIENVSRSPFVVFGYIAGVCVGLSFAFVMSAVRASSSNEYVSGFVGGILLGIVVAYVASLCANPARGASMFFLTLFAAWVISFGFTFLDVAVCADAVFGIAMCVAIYLIASHTLHGTKKQRRVALNRAVAELSKVATWQRLFIFFVSLSFVVICNGDDFLGLYFLFVVIVAFLLGLAADGDEMALDLLLDQLSKENKSLSVDKMRRPESLLTWPTAAHDAFRNGVGPLAWIGGFGILWHVSTFCERLCSIFGSRMRDVDKDGDGKVSAEEVKGLLKELVADTRAVSSQVIGDIRTGKDSETGKSAENDHNILAVLDEYMFHRPRLGREFAAEIETMIMFQLLVLLAADEKLKSEQVVFQKFMSEYRFKLLANGIKPPPHIFSSKSHTTVDVNVVASWIERMTEEKRERFFSLKNKFTNARIEQSRRQDEDDANWAIASHQLLEYRHHRKYEMSVQHYDLLKLHRAQREESGENKLELPEHVHVAREILQRIEDDAKAGASDLCESGSYGRDFQFVDPDFPHTQTSVGQCQSAHLVRSWKVAKDFNNDATLFEDGTDPDDIFQGELYNSWLLSAISILAASGGVGDNDVDPLVDRLFINKTSDVGAYAIQLYQNGQWEIVVVDDFFPAKDDGAKGERSAGAAFAHSKKFREIWVPLLEKAFAKYYGSYAELEQGFTEQALTVLTGCPSEVIYLCQASRGTNKVVLWSKLLKYFKNKFLLGAGTISHDLASRELMESGLVFGATYTVLDVRDIYGNHLIKLRNPPDYGGERNTEWNGDWSDNSNLWNAKLRNRLKHSASDDDGTFWMSFDDFCASFRCLFVCHYYDPQKWHSYSFQACWSIESKTAQGVPSFQNKACDLTKLPHFSLEVHRPTDFIVDLTQSENGTATLIEPPLPMCLYIVKVPKIMFVSELSNSNVVASSGEFTRSRCVSVSASLMPGRYVVVAASFYSGEESPIELSVHSNYPVHMKQLTEIPEDLHTKLAKKAFEKAKQIQKQVEDRARLELARRGIGKSQLDAFGSALKNGMTLVNDGEATKIMEGGAASSSPSKAQVWSEEIDPDSGQVYYYNKDTGEAVWDMPPDYDPAAAAEAKRLKAEKKKKKRRRKCNLCGRSKPNGTKMKQHPQWKEHGHMIGDVIKCEGTCGAFFHPVCAGFTDENCTDRWPSFKCSLCE